MLAQLDLNQVEQTGLPGNHIPLNFGAVVNSIVPYIFGAAGIALLIYLVMGGFQLMLSRGDPKAIQAAQGKITNALIGFIIVVIAFALASLLGQILGVNIFSNVFGGGGGGGIGSH